MILGSVILLDVMSISSRVFIIGWNTKPFVVTKSSRGDKVTSWNQEIKNNIYEIETLRIKQSRIYLIQNNVKCLMWHWNWVQTKNKKRLQYILGQKSLSYEDITLRLSSLSMHEQKIIINPSITLWQRRWAFDVKANSYNPCCIWWAFHNLHSYHCTDIVILKYFQKCQKHQYPRAFTLSTIVSSFQLLLPSGFWRERRGPGDVGAPAGLLRAAGAKEAARPVRRRQGWGENTQRHSLI